MSFIRKIFYSRILNSLIINALYPFKKYIPNKFKIPVSRRIHIFSENNNLNFTANETSPMLRELFWNHRYCDFEFSNILIDVSKSAKTFFDIGSNIGK